MLCRSALAGSAGSVAERAKELWDDRVAAAVLRLGDPDTTSAAFHELGTLREPSAVPAVVELLRHGDATVREYAALTLKFLPDPTDEAVDALARVMREDVEDDPKWRAAAALVAIGAPRAAPSFTEGLMYFPPVRDLAIEGLGMTGESACVARLLRYRPVAERAVDLALSRLANRTFASHEEFQEWWTANRERPRRLWVLAGFAAAGIHLDNLTSKRSVSKLLDALADPRPHIRSNALRAMRELTGKSWGWDALPAEHESPRVQLERRVAVARWRRFWAESGGK